MGLTAFQTLPGGPFSPAGYEDPQAAGLNPHPIAPPVVQSSLSFDGSACEPAWGWSCRSQAGPARWATALDHPLPQRFFSTPPIPPPPQGEGGRGGAPIH